MSMHPGCIIEWGGNPKDHQRAQEDSWQRMLHFFNEYVGTGPTKRTITSRL